MFIALSAKILADRLDALSLCFQLRESGGRKVAGVQGGRYAVHHPQTAYFQDFVLRGGSQNLKQLGFVIDPFSLHHPVFA